MNLEEITKDACEVVRDAVSFIKKESLHFDRSKVEHKGVHDLVSYVDKTAEKILVSGLSKVIKQSGFITEESTVKQEAADYRWIIDPLDGTTNFVHGLPCYCVSIALLAHDKLVLGIVHEVNLDECFYAWKDGGAWLNGKRIFVSDTPLLKHALLATGFPYTNYTRMKPYMEVFDYCMRHTRGLRRLGSAAADLAYVACGRMDGFYEYGLKSWDVAGGIVLVSEAGGCIADFKGGTNYLFGEEIITCNAGIFDEFLEVTKNAFTTKHD
jgi:myo-inositol-1(or 4)-monophosphatase